MNLALTSRWFRAGAAAERLALGLREVGIQGLHLVAPPAAATGWRETLTGAGIVTRAVAADPEVGASTEGTRFSTALAAAIEVAAALKAPAVVVEGGRIPGAAGARLADLEASLRKAARGSGEDAAPWLAEGERLRAERRDRLVEAAARALHGPLKDGVPLALRNGDGLDDLVGHAEIGWLLDALPRLAVWFDPARAQRAVRLTAAPALTAWTDAWASRAAGVVAHGLGSDLGGHAHPEDAGPDWGSLGASLPRRLTWVLDVSGSLSAADVRDAVRYLKASGAFGRA